jgi:hypothetical protein
LRLGETVKLGYVDQSRETLAADKTVWEEISEGLDVIELGKRSVQSRAYVASFNFRGADQQKKVGQLSGGERNRVHLAKMVKSGANVLKRPYCNSPAARSSSATTAGSSTARRPTSWPSRATARRSGSRATTKTTRPTASAASAPRPNGPTASSTSR